MVENGAHYRTKTADYPAGVYRVVGSADEVVLLRLTDGDGQRRFSGRLVSVTGAELESCFERATNPDAGFTPRRSVRNALSGLFWSVRRLF